MDRAIKADDFEEVEDLMNSAYYERMYTSSEINHMKLVKFYLKHKKDISPFIRSASYNGHINVVKFILDNGGDIHYEEDIGLEMACENGELEMVKFLVLHGADKSKGFKTAITYGRYDIVKFFVEKGVDINLDDGYAIRVACYQNYRSMIYYLVEKGADIHSQNNYPVRIACSEGYLDLIKYLIEHGADIYTENQGINSGLCMASINGHLEVVKYLVEVLNVTINDLSFRLASFYGHLNIIEYFVEKGVDIYTHNEEGFLWANYFEYKDTTKNITLFNDDLDYECSVCLEKNIKPYIKCKNNHPHCFECMKQVWKTDTRCPICRQ